MHGCVINNVYFNSFWMVGVRRPYEGSAMVLPARIKVCLGGFVNAVRILKYHII